MPFAWLLQEPGNLGGALRGRDPSRCSGRPHHSQCLCQPADRGKRCQHHRRGHDPNSDIGGGLYSHAHRPDPGRGQKVGAKRLFGESSVGILFLHTRRNEVVACFCTGWVSPKVLGLAGVCSGIMVGHAFAIHAVECAAFHGILRFCDAFRQ